MSSTVQRHISAINRLICYPSNPTTNSFSAKSSRRSCTSSRASTSRENFSCNKTN
ncbi:unnamed protein product, partial [Tenebrio molitor]